MRFAMSYSCGKDSTLALHKMIAKGHEPVSLITMFRQDQQRSWFHGADLEMLAAYERSLGIPMLRAISSGPSYARNFEKALLDAKALGATTVVFGDIDLEANRRWEEDRCEATGLNACFPLWQGNRLALAEECLALGYKCLLKNVSEKAIDVCSPGELLDQDILARLDKAGLDPCGENGEYHTLVVDGPIFHAPLNFKCGQILSFPGHFSISVNIAP